MTSNARVKIPWLLAPEWKDLPMSKGLDHHRVPVGIILEANEDITFTLESENLDSVRVRLLNNDAATEKTHVITNSPPISSVTLNIDSVSVPFVDGQYLAKLPSEFSFVSVDYPESSKFLPIYHYGDNEDSFFEQWDSQDSEYALIESKYFSMLIPEVDKEPSRALPNGDHLDDLILFFDEIFIIYSKLIGLSLEGTGLNRNVRNRFFIKADRSGYGAAYYCDWCTAETSESVKSFWMDLKPSNWGALHEIAHGHELECLSDETFSTSEVWNNILVVFYQYIMMGDEILTKGGLSREETKINKELQMGKPVKEWGLFQKLSFLLHMFIKAGQNSFIRFNQLTRQERAGNPYYASGTLFLEKIMSLFAVDFNLDVYPYMRLANAMISDEQIIQHYYSFSEVAYPLNFLISNTDVLKSVKEKLHLWYDTSLVTPIDLRVTNLKSDFSIQIDRNVFYLIFGEIFKLMDGHRTVAEMRIFGQNITLKNIPIGVYKIFIPSSFFNSKYVFNDVYVIIQDDISNKLTLSARKVETSSLLCDKIKFLGYADNHFASLSVDPLKHTIKFHFFSENPHSYFKDQTYCSIIIKNSENEIILTKVIEGVDSALGLYEIPIYQPVQVEIFHAETKQRLKMEDPQMESIINSKTNTNTLIVSKLGFNNKYAIQMKLSERLLKRIDKVANKIRSHPFLYERDFCHPKCNLFLAIENFKHMFRDHPFSSTLEKQYKDCLPPKCFYRFVNALTDREIGSDNEFHLDDDFYEITHTNTGRKLILCTRHDRSPLLFGKIKFLGLGDIHVATLFIDSRKHMIHFHVLSPDPHSYFEGETYFSITVRDHENEIIFSKSIEGIDPTQEQFLIPLSQQVEINIFHAETKSRLLTDNPVMNYIIDRENNVNNFEITKQDLNRKQCTNRMCVRKRYLSHGCRFHRRDSF